MPEAPGRPKLSQPRAKRTFMLRLNNPAEKHANDEIEKRIKSGTFQNWIRDILVRELPMPALPKSNGHLEEHYADPEDSA